MNFSFLKNRKIIIGLWLVVALVAAIKQFVIGKYNNYLIFKHVFFHTIEKKSLYGLYPELYFDRNHYGPIFSLFIAPFAVLPDSIGMPLWAVFNAAVLVYAITKIPVDAQKVNLILWICFHEFLTAILGFQFNPIMTAIIILSYVYITEEKDIWAAFCIALGTFIKLYGVVGLAFFFFSKNKPKFILSLLLWSLVFFGLPMLISSPEFVLSSYKEWMLRLVEKNNENAGLDSMQDISVMGMFRRIFHAPELSNLLFLIPGLALFGLPYLRLKLYSNEKFRLLLLASVLIFTVIFSSGSESPTYIIAFVGVAIWFVLQEKPISKTTWFLFIFAMILTSFSPSDIVPRFLRETYIRPYALKALPCVLIWGRIIYEMLFFNSNQNKIEI
jgi:Glycosyltransferase family 87